MRRKSHQSEAKTHVEALPRPADNRNVADRRRAWPFSVGRVVSPNELFDELQREADGRGPALTLAHDRGERRALRSLVDQPLLELPVDYGPAVAERTPFTGRVPRPRTMCLVKRHDRVLDRLHGQRLSRYHTVPLHE